MLAFARANGAIAVIDDGPARKIAHANSVRNTGTLGLLGEALRENLLSIDLISRVADDLLKSKYRLPFRKGDFRKWAHDQGLIPPVD